MHERVGRSDDGEKIRNQIQILVITKTRKKRMIEKIHRHIGCGEN